MRKLSVLVLVFAVALTFGVTAHATKQFFFDFSIDVPLDWSTNVDEGDYSVTFTAPDESESLKIKHASREAINPFTFAISIANELNGDFPVEIGNGEFEIVLPDGTKARTRHVESWGVLMVSKNDFDDLKAVLSSWNF
jgi:hypothetical protein